MYATKWLVAVALFLVLTSLASSQQPDDPDVPPPPSDGKKGDIPVPADKTAKKDDKAVKDKKDVKTLVGYLRTIARAHPEYHLQDATDPISFAIPLETLNEESTKLLLKGAKIESAKDGILFEDMKLEQVHLALNKEADEMDVAHVFVTGTVMEKPFPEAKGKAYKIPVGLDKRTFDKTGSATFAKILMEKIEAKTQIPNGPVRVVIDLTRGTVVDLPTPSPDKK